MNGKVQSWKSLFKKFSHKIFRITKSTLTIFLNALTRVFDISDLVIKIMIKNYFSVLIWISNLCKCVKKLSLKVNNDVVWETFNMWFSHYHKPLAPWHTILHYIISFLLNNDGKFLRDVVNYKERWFSSQVSQTKQGLETHTQSSRSFGITGMSNRNSVGSFGSRVKHSEHDFVALVRNINITRMKF